MTSVAQKRLIVIWRLAGQKASLVTVKISIYFFRINFRALFVLLLTFRVSIVPGAIIFTLRGGMTHLNLVIVNDMTILKQALLILLLLDHVL